MESPTLDAGGEVQDAVKSMLGTSKTWSGGSGALDPSIPVVPSLVGKGWLLGDEWAVALGHTRTKEAGKATEQGCQWKERE